MRRSLNEQSSRSTSALQMTHVGYRCPNADCTDRSRVYRSALADAQALPGFTFGLEIVALVGYLKLSQHQTVDEVHRGVNERRKRLSDQSVKTKCDGSF